MSGCREQMLNPLLRRYDPIAKHGPGGHGTPMDLGIIEATELLRAAIYDPTEAMQSTPSLWGYRNGRVYRFMCDNAQPASWHGYPADEKPPNAVLQQWRTEDVITNAEFNKLRRLPSRGH